RALAGVVVLAGCYAPDLRDCTVACSGSGDCASGQVCGSDHLCAAPAIAGTCGRTPPPGVDAHGSDAPAPDAAPTSVTLAVHVMGPGQVTLASATPPQTCAMAPPQNGSCTFVVPFDQPVVLDAMPDPGQQLDGWTGASCKNQGATCTFNPTADLTITAKFGKAGPG
ncbi:MAG TPA: hypothetical protein VLX92_30615, partial [Kofleriaceae bacterium]|nr:hypothetical protein [Kofleriaceae bacterium]